jgi:hypothetical protein
MFSAGLNKSRLKHQDWVYNGNDKHNVPELQFKQHQLVPQWLTAWYLYLRGSNKLREIYNEEDYSELWLRIGAFLKLDRIWAPGQCHAYIQVEVSSSLVVS